MSDLTRRNVLAGASLAVAGGAAPAEAAAPMSGKQAPSIYRYRIGSMEVTAIYDGVWYRPIDEKFVRQADYADVRREMSNAFMPEEKLATPFTMLLVNTGKKLILLDTGTGGQIASTAGSFTANLKAAGINPKAIDQIVISHFHPDHINGIKTKDNALIFPNAEIMVPEAEWKFLERRREHARRAGQPEDRLPQRAAHLRRYRQGRDALPPRQGSRARHRDGRRGGPHARPHGVRACSRARTR